MRRILWALAIILALLVGLIPIGYLINGIEKGYLELKSNAALGSGLWWTLLYVHIVTGGVAIIVGWTQFSNWLLKQKPTWHRRIGKVYVMASLPAGISGFGLGFYATGGILPAIGFITVACIYLFTTWKGYTCARRKRITEHQNFMTYSYATCLAAVSLRLYVPLSTLFTDDYILAYTIIAWLAWIPNLLIAYWVNKLRAKKLDNNF